MATIEGLSSALRKWGVNLPTEWTAEKLLPAIQDVEDFLATGASIEGMPLTKTRARRIEQIAIRSSALSRLCRDLLDDYSPSEAVFFDRQLRSGPGCDLAGGDAARQLLESLMDLTGRIGPTRMAASEIAISGDDTAFRPGELDVQKIVVTKRLPGLFKTIFQTEPTWFHDSNGSRPASKGVRFIGAALESMGIHKGPAAIMKMYREAKRHTRSENHDP